MSRRPTDWSPLAGSDPVPGDPDEVERIASRYTETARALRDQSARLRALAGDRGWESEAADEWRHQGREVAEKLGKVVDRYETAGRALRTYGGELRGAQHRSERALDLAQDAERRARAADRALDDEARRHAQAPPDAPPPDTSHLRRQVEQAAGDLAEARHVLRTAEEDRDHAATAAAHAIEGMTGSDGLDDGRFAGVRAWFGDAVEWLDRNLVKITEIAGWIATVAGVLALAVGWIPVIGQLAAALLTGIALLAGVVALIGSIITTAQGRTGWTDILVNAVSLVTLGIGRAALRGVTLSARGARAAAQSGTVAGIVAGGTLARGGSVGGKTVHRLTVTARRQAKAQPGMGLTRDQMASGLTYQPTRWPQLRELGGGFDPVAVGRSAREGAEGLLDPANWSGMRQAWQAGERGHMVLDDAARLELQQLNRLSEAARAMPRVGAAELGVVAQSRWLYGSTDVGIAVDLADKWGVMDPLHDATVVPPR